jgi:phospholipid/cholesterol/gamma-HCH transport system substrate-binding protein
VNKRTLINLIWFNAIFALLLYWAFNNIVSWDRLEKPYTITGDFEQAAGVKANAEVTYLGVHYGRVSSVERRDAGVRITMKIDKGKDIPAGTIARVFRKSAIGEPYIDFQPAEDYDDDEVIEDGDNIPMVDDDGVQRTTVPLEFSELLRSASNLISSIDEEAAGSLVHELALALDGRGDELASLTRSFDEITRTFVTRTDQLDRLAENSTRLTRVLADHRLSLSASLDHLKEIGQALRDADGDLEVLLETGPDFLGTTADLVADQKVNLDCLLHDLTTVTVTLGSDGPIADVAATIRNGPTGFGYVAASVDQEADGPWVRVNLLPPEPGSEPAKQYVPKKSLPVVPTVSPCVSALTPYTGAPFTPSGTVATPSGPPMPATGASAATGAAVVALLAGLLVWRLRRA